MIPIKQYSTSVLRTLSANDLLFWMMLVNEYLGKFWAVLGVNLEPLRPKIHFLPLDLRAGVSYVFGQFLGQKHLQP